MQRTLRHVPASCGRSLCVSWAHPGCGRTAAAPRSTCSCRRPVGPPPAARTAPCRLNRRGVHSSAWCNRPPPLFCRKSAQVHDRSSSAPPAPPRYIPRGVEAIWPCRRSRRALDDALWPRTSSQRRTRRRRCQQRLITAALSSHTQQMTRCAPPLISRHALTPDVLRQCCPLLERGASRGRYGIIPNAYEHTFGLSSTLVAPHAVARGGAGVKRRPVRCAEPAELQAATQGTDAEARRHLRYLS